jgi:hypothetical protein
MGHIGNGRKILVVKPERGKEELSKPSCRCAKSIKRDSEQMKKRLSPG